MGSSDEFIKRLRDADDIALRITRYEFRKAMGIYYIYWSTITITFSILYFLAQEFPLIINQGVANVIAIVIVILYVILSYFILGGRFSRVRVRYSRARALIMYIVFSVLIALIIYLELTPRYAGYTIMAALLYALLIVVMTINGFVKVGVKPRYYDYAAMGSFIVCFTLGLGYMYYSMLYVLSLIWIYAGIRSLLEVIEGE
ncbi:hypothetical protein [Vulcanisaeta thermophila]|uniref:hypothetical protein n=1 Tax=Vulcanisaeta thermophila TaxID=867917 RepID=UPI0008532CDD|nr:hypothetical protein [Vulcanisaeta thermophila]